MGHILPARPPIYHRPGAKRLCERAGALQFGEFDFQADIYFGEHGVEVRFAQLFGVIGEGAQTRAQGAVGAARQKPLFQFLERIECGAPARDLAGPFGAGTELEAALALQREQRIDPRHWLGR